MLDFRARLFAHVQRLSLSYHDARGSSDAAFRIQYDAPALQYITINGFLPLGSAVLTLCGMIIVMVRLDWQLALVAMAVSPVLYVLAYKFTHPLQHRWIASKVWRTPRTRWWRKFSLRCA